MSKFAELVQSLRVVKSERSAVEAKITAAQRELQELSNAPLCKADAIVQLDAYVDGCKAMFRENLTHVLKLHNVAGRERFDDIGGGLPLLRTFSGTFDDRIICAVLAEPLKAAIREAMKDVPCADTAPLAKRKARRAELEKEIETLKTQLREIMDAADQARAVL